jgi:hypothetical protein
MHIVQPYSFSKFSLVEIPKIIVEQEALILKGRSGSPAFREPEPIYMENEFRAQVCDLSNKHHSLLIKILYGLKFLLIKVVS